MQGGKRTLQWIFKLFEEREKETRKWQHIPCSGICTINMKMTCLPKSIYRCNAIQIKIPIPLLAEIEKKKLSQNSDGTTKDPG